MKVFEQAEWHKSAKNETETFETGGQLGSHFVVVHPIHFLFS